MRRRGWAACTLLTVSITACGSSSGSKVTQAQWLANANGACTALNAQTRALGPRPQPQPGEAPARTLQRSAGYLDRLIPLQVAAVRNIRALGSPPQNAQLVARALTAVDVLNTDFKDARTAANAGNLKTFLTVIRGRVNGPDGARATNASRQAGLTVCAES